MEKFTEQRKAEIVPPAEQTEAGQDIEQYVQGLPKDSDQGGKKEVSGEAVSATAGTAAAEIPGRAEQTETGAGTPEEQHTRTLADMLSGNARLPANDIVDTLYPDNQQSK